MGQDEEPVGTPVVVSENETLTLSEWVERAKQHLVLDVDLTNMSVDGQYILGTLLSEWLEHFKYKQRDYGDDANRLGIKGAFVDIHRKEGKIKRAIWDGQRLQGEQPREILLDLIGHCFLVIAAIDNEEGQARKLGAMEQVDGSDFKQGSGPPW